MYLPDNLITLSLKKYIATADPKIGPVLIGILKEMEEIKHFILQLFSFLQPSCVAVSWHGPDYDKPLRQRSQDCDQLFAFLTLMRKNNFNIPIISKNKKILNLLL